MRSSVSGATMTRPADEPAADRAACESTPRRAAATQLRTAAEGTLPKLNPSGSADVVCASAILGNPRKRDASPRVLPVRSAHLQTGHVGRSSGTMSLLACNSFCASNHVSIHDWQTTWPPSADFSWPSATHAERPWQASRRKPPSQIKHVMSTERSRRRASLPWCSRRLYGLLH